MPGSARAHVPGITKARKVGAALSRLLRVVTWAACEKGKVIFTELGRDLPGLEGTFDQVDKIRRFHCRLLDTLIEQRSNSETHLPCGILRASC